MNRLKPYWLAAIFLLAALIRCVSIATRGIQYDDAFSIFLAQRSLGQIIQGTAADTMPPFYYFLLHFWLLVSQNIGWLRLLSVLLSLGIVAFLYLLVRQLFDEQSALWAAFFAAISPLQYYHAQDIRMYALLAFTQLGYALFFARIWKNTGSKPALDWLGLIGLGTAAMYSHNLAIFFLVAPDFFLLFKRRWALLGKFLAAQVVIGLAALPWLVMVPGQLAKIQSAFWTPAPGLVEIIQSLMMSVTGLPLSGIWFGVGLVLSLVLCVFVIWELLKIKDSKESLLFILCLVIIPPLLLFLASYVIRPVFVTRGFLTATLAYLGLAGIIVARKWSRPAGVIITLSLVLAAMVGIPSQASFQDFPRSPFAQAGAFLSAHATGNDIVLHDNKLSYFPMLYYWPALPQKFLPDEPGSPNDTFAVPSQAAMNIYPAQDLVTAIGSSKKIFFIVFKQTIADYQAAGQNHPQLASLESTFRQVSLNQFNDLDVYEFEQ